MKKLFLLLLALIPGIANAEIRIGMIGLDTSHVIAFTKIINDSSETNHVPGGKVVAAFKGGSPDVKDSWSRVDGYTKQLREKWGVKIVDTIEELCEEVDVVMIESVDGRPHLEQARPVLKAGKRLYIDKPVAGSLRDAIEIFRLAKEHGVPVFSSSSLRFHPGIVELKNSDVGEIKGAFSTGPGIREPHHPDLFWYGVHATEAMFTLLGTGCETVSRVTATDTDIVTGVWKDGRVGTGRYIRNGAWPFRVTLFGTKAVLDQKPGGGYGPLIVEVMKFFQTGIPPVSAEETIEIFAFMEAADESKRLGGCPVSVTELLKKNGYERAP